MTYAPVDITLLDQNDEPVEGAVLVVFSQDLATRYHQETTGVDGMVSALLPRYTTYEVRINHPDISQGVMLFEIEDPVVVATIELHVTRILPTDAVDPLLCNVYETFSAVGSIAAGVVTARLVDALVVDRYRVTLNTPIPSKIDRNGRYSNEFPRGARVIFALPGVDARVEVTIPDQASVRLSDLLFPYIKEVRLIPDITALAVGEETDSEVQLHFSDGSIASLDTHGLVVTTDEFLAANLEGGRLHVRGVSAGEATLSLVWQAPIEPFPSTYFVPRTYVSVIGEERAVTVT